MIVKPVAACQGWGIFLTKQLADVDLSQQMVVQKYLRFPYLIDGLKFDLRLYVLVTSVDPLKIFLFDKGMARFATTKYDLSEPNNY